MSQEELHNEVAQRMGLVDFGPREGSQRESDNDRLYRRSVLYNSEQAPQTRF